MVGADGFQHPDSECSSLNRGSLDLKWFGVPKEATEICVNHAGEASPIKYCYSSGGSLPGILTGKSSIEMQNRFLNFSEFYEDTYGAAYLGAYGEKNGGKLNTKNRYQPRYPNNYLLSVRLEPGRLAPEALTPNLTGAKYLALLKNFRNFTKIRAHSYPKEFSQRPFF